MNEEAVAWLVKWKESGSNCSRPFISQDEALQWAVHLQSRKVGCTDRAVVPLYERPAGQEGA